MTKEEILTMCDELIENFSTSTKEQKQEYIDKLSSVILNMQEIPDEIREYMLNLLSYVSNNLDTTGESIVVEVGCIADGGDVEIDPKVYAYVRSLWEQGKYAEHGYQPE